MSAAALRLSPPPAAAARVMVVDDSVVARGLLARWLQQAGFTVAAVFSNGIDAVAAAAGVNPDIILLDIMMPGMTGLDAIPLLLKAKPDVTIIVVSSLAPKGADLALRCLSSGAKEYLAKPASNRHITTSFSFRDELIAMVGVFQRQAAEPARVLPLPAAPAARAPAVRPELIVIGASTGGPQAVAGLLRGVAGSLGGASAVIAQHMPGVFTPVFARNLASFTGLDVKEAEAGEALLPGWVYIGPGGCHVTVCVTGAGPRLMVRGADETAPGCKPSVDRLFKSAAETFGPRALGIILSGMGSDGAKGCEALVRAGGAAAAQDPAASTVGGMPGAAQRTGACFLVAPVPELASRVRALLEPGA